MKKLYSFFAIFLLWSNFLTYTNIKADTISLRAGESFTSDSFSIKLVSARAKWSTSGDSALSVIFEVNIDGKIKTLNLARFSSDPPIEIAKGSAAFLINGDNDYAKLLITPQDSDSGVKNVHNNHD